MKNFITVILIASLFVSCSDREVQLPHTTNNDITEVLDVSPIYIFYDETKTDSVDFNRRNMISTTNWLVNIDKRLTLKQVLPHLQYLQEKRHGDGMHKNENAKNYFTCFNPETENLSFIEFTDINYSIKDNNYEDDQIYISIQSNGKTSASNDSHNVWESFFDYIDSKEEYYKKIPHIKMTLVFHQDVSFQHYVEVKAILLSKKEKSIFNISKNEFIYK